MPPGAQMIDLGLFQDALARHRTLCRETMQHLAALPADLQRDAFDVYRQNYFFRTATTPWAVGQTYLAATRQFDLETMASAAQNAYEESGAGRSAASHLRQLETSHNRLAAVVHHLPPLRVSDADQFPRLTSEALKYRRVQEELYGADTYGTVLGASYAQEAAAVDMLQAIFECLFVPHAETHPPKEFEEVTEYFTCHLDGLEAKHAELALEAIMAKGLDDPEHYSSALAGAQRFLAAQGELWIALRGQFQ